MGRWARTRRRDRRSLSRTVAPRRSRAGAAGSGWRQRIRLAAQDQAGGTRTKRAASAADVGTSARDGDPCDDTAVALPGGTVVVPVRVLASDAPVIADQHLHRIWQRNDLRRTRCLDPLAEEAI